MELILGIIFEYKEVIEQCSDPRFCCFLILRLDDEIYLCLKHIMLELVPEVLMPFASSVFLDLMIEYILEKVECQFPFEYPVEKFGSNEKAETLIFDRPHFYEKSHLIVDHVKTFKGTKHIEHKIGVIIRGHLEREKPIVSELELTDNGLTFIVSSDIPIIRSDLKIIEMGVKLRLESRIGLAASRQRVKDLSFVEM